jgi:aldehyde dehydrogenase (NAD+)
MNSNEIASVFEQQQSFFKSGTTRSYEFRIKQLHKLKELIISNEELILKALHKDLGKHPFEAYSSEIGTLIQELNHAIQNLRLWMENKSVQTPLVHQPASSYIMNDPLGVILIIAPWNYPFMLCFAPLISAIAAGNCAFIKPSNQTKSTSELISKLVTEEFKPEYIYVVEGPGILVGTELLNKYRFDHVFFTGSKDIGKEVMRMAANHLSPVTLELGGKSPAIVSSNVNIKVAAKRIMWAKFWNAGQTCVAPDYVLVHQSIYEEFKKASIEAIEGFFGQNPEQSSSYGRIVNLKRQMTLKSFLEEGDIICGGNTNDGERYFAPTLLENVSLDSPIMKEEIFGPILPLIPFSSDDEAIEITERNPYPLACYIFSKKKTQARYFLDRIRFGGGAINIALLHFAHTELPVGGVGFSGMGSYHGHKGFETFSHQKSIISAGFFPDISIRYAPFSKVSKLIKWMMS